MAIPQEYSFTRYLAAKVSVDDRALNRHVWGTLKQALPPASKGKPTRALEAGAGIGTMVERLLAWGLLTHAHYSALDADPENIACAAERLAGWAEANGYEAHAVPDGEMVFEGRGRRLALALEAIDLFDFANRETGMRRWDLLVAHAFLDLVDIPGALPKLFSLLNEGGLFYFSLNYDGAMLLEPVIDPALDALIVDRYHSTMDARIVSGRPSGDSRAGRHLFRHLRAAGGQILDAGSSDWVVYPGADGYSGDEAYFLHFIIHTIHKALAGHPKLDPALFKDWVDQRHAQIESRELVYIAHQLDFVGRVSG